MVLPSVYWDLYGIFYDRMRLFPPYRSMIERVYESLDVRPGGIYFDAGCGTGALIERIASQDNVTVYGMDFSPHMLRLALRKAKHLPGRVILTKGDISKKLPFGDECFDGIACIHVLEYLEKPFPIIREFHRTLRKNGKLTLVSLKRKLNFSSYIPYYEEFLRTQKLKAINSLFSFLAVGMLNIPMRTGYKIRFYGEKLKDILRSYDFFDIRTETVYAGQSILIQCKK